MIFSQLEAANVNIHGDKVSDREKFLPLMQQFRRAMMEGKEDEARALAGNMKKYLRAE